MQTVMKSTYDAFTSQMERFAFSSHARSQTKPYLDLCNLCAGAIHTSARAVQSMCKQTTLKTKQTDPQHCGHSCKSVLVC